MLFSFFIAFHLETHQNVFQEFLAIFLHTKYFIFHHEQMLPRKLFINRKIGFTDKVNNYCKCVVVLRQKATTKILLSGMGVAQFFPDFRIKISKNRNLFEDNMKHFDTFGLTWGQLVQDWHYFIVRTFSRKMKENFLITIISMFFRKCWTLVEGST